MGGTQWGYKAEKGRGERDAVLRLLRSGRISARHTGNEGKGQRKPRDIAIPPFYSENRVTPAKSTYTRRWVGGWGGMIVTLLTGGVRGSLAKVIPSM
jgi:hypothetical protein